MKLRLERINDINVLYLEGSLTVASAQDVFAQIASLLEEGETRFLLQMSAVEFIDSTGLGTVVRLSKRVREAKGKLSLAEPQPKIREMFDLTRLDKILPIYRTHEEALEAF